MVFIGAAILPHGTMPFDGDPNSDSKKCRQRHDELSAEMRVDLQKIYSNTCDAAQQIASLAPDLILLLTPHGIGVTNHYCVYINATAKGNCLWNNEWSEFEVAINIDSGKAQELITHLNTCGSPVEGLNAFTNTEMPLRWGEAVPLWYLTKFLKKDVHFIVMSQNLTPLATEPEPWRMQLGRGIAEYIDNLEERVAVVISGDLSHYHPTDCTNTLYLADPRWKMKVDKYAAESFEKVVCQWVTAKDSSGLWEPAVAKPLLDTLVRTNPDAGSCGIKGFVVLHSLLNYYHQKNAKVRPQIYVCCAPTYYGMMAASFVVENKQK